MMCMGVRVGVGRCACARASLSHGARTCAHPYTSRAQVTYLLGGGSRSIPPSSAELEALREGRADVPPAALERLAHTLVAR